MNAVDIINNAVEQRRTRFAFELLPPLKGDGMGGVFESIDRLIGFDPAYINVTFHREGIKQAVRPDGSVEWHVVRRRPGTVGISAAIQKKYGVEGAKSRIYATTDKARGALKTLASREGYESFVVPDNVGGRYSVLTAVGLLPIACCGIDIEALMHGAQAEREDTLKRGVESAAVQYAMSRQALYADGKNIEILAAYEPAFRFMAEWWKQLYGESEGKDGKGIFPASVDLTPDLHSMGQYIQDGIRMLQETVVFFDNSRTSVTVPSDEENLDGLNYLAGREMSYINEKAMQATKAAHISGGVPVTEIRLPEIGEEALGALIYFFEFACGVSGYMEGVNPFNQPGVEAYKKNMFHLLGKPGY